MRNTILMSNSDKVRQFQNGALTKLRFKLDGTKYIKEGTEISKTYDYATGRPAYFKWIDSDGELNVIRSHYAVGQCVYIREPFAYAKSTHIWIEDDVVVREETYLGIVYRSDEVYFIPNEPQYDANDPARPTKVITERRSSWFPAVEMSRDYVRLYAVITDIRFERLQDMTEEDAIAEGWPDLGVDEDSPLQRYTEAWDRRLKRGEIDFAWCCNPWTEAVTFRLVTPFDDAMKAKPNKFINIEEVYLNGTLMYSSDKHEDIEEYLKDVQTPYEIKTRKKLTTGRNCPKCGGSVYTSDTPGYRYQCFSCDEDFYEFEVK